MADLASILSGTDPMAPLELQAYQQQQMLNSARDASQWQNQGLAGALARTIAGFGGGGAQNTVNQIAQQRMAAYPDIVKMLAAPEGATSYAAANPNISPLAMSMVANQTPLAAAQGRQLSIENQLGAFDLAGFQRRNAAADAQQPGGLTPPVKGLGGGLAPPATVPRPQASAGPTATGAGPSGPSNPDTAAIPLVNGAPSVEPTDYAAVSPGTRAAAMARMSPQARQQFIARLNAMAAQHGQSGATP